MCAHHHGRPPQLAGVCPVKVRAPPPPRPCLAPPPALPVPGAPPVLDTARAGQRGPAAPSLLRPAGATPFLVSTVSAPWGSAQPSPRRLVRSGDHRSASTRCEVRPRAAPSRPQSPPPRNLTRALCSEKQNRPRSPSFHVTFPSHHVCGGGPEARSWPRNRGAGTLGQQSCTSTRKAGSTEIRLWVWGCLGSQWV